MILIARAETLFMSLFVKDAKKSIYIYMYNVCVYVCVCVCVCIYIYKMTNRPTLIVFSLKLFANQRNEKTIFTFQQDILFIKSIHVNKISF